MVHSTVSFSSSVIHQSSSHCWPMICHLKPLKIGWTFLNVLLLKKKGRYLFVALVYLHYPVPRKSTVIFCPLLTYQDWTQYHLYLRLYFVETPSEVIFVFLSKKEKDAGLSFQSFTILISLVSRYVKRASTKAVW